MWNETFVVQLREKLRKFAWNDSGKSRKTIVVGTWCWDGDLKKGYSVVVLTILPWPSVPTYEIATWVSREMYKLVLQQAVLGYNSVGDTKETDVSRVSRRRGEITC